MIYVLRARDMHSKRGIPLRADMPTCATSWAYKHLQTKAQADNALCPGPITPLHAMAVSHIDISHLICSLKHHRSMLV